MITTKRIKTIFDFVNEEVVIYKFNILHTWYSSLSNNNFRLLCKRVLSLNSNIRFAGIITRMGRLIAGGMRHGVASMEDDNDSLKLYVQFALRSQIGKDYDSAFGRAIYTFTEREKIKLASFPLKDNHILRVSIMKEEKNHTQIIQNILGIIKEAEVDLHS